MKNIKKFNGFVNENTNTSNVKAIIKATALAKWIFDGFEDDELFDLFIDSVVKGRKPITENKTISEVIGNTFCEYIPSELVKNFKEIPAELFEMEDEYDICGGDIEIDWI